MEWVLYTARSQEITLTKTVDKQGWLGVPPLPSIGCWRSSSSSSFVEVGYDSSFIWMWPILTLMSYWNGWNARQPQRNDLLHRPPSIANEYHSIFHHTHHQHWARGTHNPQCTVPFPINIAPVWIAIVERDSQYYCHVARNNNYQQLLAKCAAGCPTIPSICLGPSSLRLVLPLPCRKGDTPTVTYWKIETINFITWAFGERS